MADDTKRMNVLYSSDDNYAQHMGVSIYSLLRHNAEFENIRLYVIDNGFPMLKLCFFLSLSGRKSSG